MCPPPEKDQQRMQQRANKRFTEKMPAPILVRRKGNCTPEKKTPSGKKDMLRWKRRTVVHSRRSLVARTLCCVCFAVSFERPPPPAWIIYSPLLLSEKNRVSFFILGPPSKTATLLLFVPRMIAARAHLCIQGRRSDAAASVRKRNPACPCFLPFPGRDATFTLLRSEKEDRSRTESRFFLKISTAFSCFAPCCFHLLCFLRKRMAVFLCFVPVE